MISEEHARGRSYLLIGGWFAIAFHGYVRATHDLDLWIKDEQSNPEKFKSVLKKHGVKGLEQVRKLEFIPGFTQFSIGDSGFVIDPMTKLKSFDS